MNIHQSNTYRKDLSWLHFCDEPRVQERQQVNDAVDHEITLKILELILSSLEKVKPGCLLSLMCMFPELYLTKF